MTSLWSIDVRSDSAVDAASHAVAHSETALAASAGTANSAPLSGAWGQSLQ